jgi:plastocyanin
MQRTSRRRFLTGIATASAALAAGCSSGSSGGSGANSSAGGGGTTSAGEPSSTDATSTASPDGTTVNSGGTTASTDATTSPNGTSSGGTTTVAAGPNGRFVFAPEQVEVSVGDTVVWEFKSGGHNVSAVPQDSEEVNIPSGATPFASYESGNLYSVVEEGETYEYTFETPGEYTYVCIPHVASGMVGTVTVTG